jgi:hypothetical protein
VEASAHSKQREAAAATAMVWNFPSTTATMPPSEQTSRRAVLACFSHRHRSAMSHASRLNCCHCFGYHTASESNHKTKLALAKTIMLLANRCQLALLRATDEQNTPSAFDLQFLVFHPLIVPV